MDKARIVVMAAKRVRGREKRMKAGARVINIISVIIFAAVDLIGSRMDRNLHRREIHLHTLLYIHCVFIIFTIFLHVISEAINIKVRRHIFNSSS